MTSSSRFQSPALEDTVLVEEGGDGRMLHDRQNQTRERREAGVYSLLA